MMRALVVILALCVLGNARASDGVNDIELDRIFPKRNEANLPLVEESVFLIGRGNKRLDAKNPSKFLKALRRQPIFETLYINKLGGYTNISDTRTRTSSHIIYQTDPTFPNVYKLIEFLPVESLHKLKQDFSRLLLPSVLSGQASGAKLRGEVYTYDVAQYKSTLPENYFRALYRKAVAYMGLNEFLRKRLGLSIDYSKGMQILERIWGYKIRQEDIERAACDDFRQLQLDAYMTILETQVKTAEALTGLDSDYLKVIGRKMDLCESINVLVRFSTSDMPSYIRFSSYSSNYKHLQEKAQDSLRKITLQYHETMVKICQEMADFTFEAAQEKIVELISVSKYAELDDSFIAQICSLLAQRIEKLENNLDVICEINMMKPQDVIGFIMESDYREELRGNTFCQVFLEGIGSPRCSESSEETVRFPRLNFLSDELLISDGLLEEFTPLEAKIVLHRKFKENQISDGDVSSCDANKDD